MASKEEYDKHKAERRDEQQEAARFNALIKMTSLAALNAALGWLSGKAAINIIDFETELTNGKTVKGKSLRFQLDPPSSPVPPRQDA